MSTTLSDQDADTHEAIASTRPATRIRSNPDEHWRPSKIDAEMAAASVGVGIVSGLVAGGVMWWGDRPAPPVPDRDRPPPVASQHGGIGQRRMPKNNTTSVSLNRAIAERDRVISGLYLVLAELGVSEELAWTRAEELLADRDRENKHDGGEPRNG